MQNTLQYALQLDSQDELKTFRSQFFIPQHQGSDAIYFTGNSLGLQPKPTAAYLQQELNDWATHGVEAHFNAKNPWLSYHEAFPALLAPIVGALEEELVVMNQLTVNLHLLMVSFYQPTPQRYKIICEAKAFPSDQYAIESQVQFHGYSYQDAVVEVAPRPGQHTIQLQDILDTIEEHKSTVALVLFGGVNYYTGQLFNIKTITQAAQNAGAICGFDLAHAAGNVPLQLHQWNVDFACWCSYKYLNSGPGSVAGAYIHQRHLAAPHLHRFAGWWGHNKSTRFQMEKGFMPIPTAEGWQLSNAPIFSMAAHLASLHIFQQAGIQNIWQKAMQLSNYLHFIVNSINQNQAQQNIQIITPNHEDERGCQLSMLLQKNGKQIFDQLAKHGVVADWREPNVIRIAPVPLYNSFADVYHFGRILKQVLSSF